MNELQQLKTLCKFHEAHLNIAQSMFLAHLAHKNDLEDMVWMHLFNWEQAKEAREQAYEKIIHCYFQAVNLKEGVRDAR